MLHLLLYFLIPTLLLCGFFYLNMKGKWFTQRAAEDMNTPDAIIFLVAFIAWPVTLILAGIVAGGIYLKNHVLPED